MLKVLEEDFARIPTLLERAVDAPAPDVETLSVPAAPDPESVQLGLF